MFKKDFYELTSPQKSIWLTEQIYSGTNIGTISGTLFIDERVNIDLLKESIKIFVNKNDSMRTRIIVEDGNPKQFINSEDTIEIEVLHLESEDDLKELEEKISSHCFELSNSELYIFKIFIFKDGTGGIVSNLHHLIADAWSFGIMSKELKDIYEKLLSGDSNIEATPSYAEYIENEQKYFESERFEKDKKYWEDKYLNVPDLACIKAYQNENKNTNANRYSATLDFELCKKINEYARDNNTSAYSFFMSIYSIYLARVSNIDNVIIGTPFLNRSNFKEKNTMGMFVNTLPNRLDIDWNLTFKDFLKYTTDEQRNIFRHSKYPYNKLLENIRKHEDASRNLYDIFISYQNARNDSQVSNIKYHTYWNYCGNISESMEIHVFDMDNTGSLQLFYDYQTIKFSKDEVKCIHSRIMHIIEQVLNGNIYLKDIEIITSEEKQKLLYDFNDTYLKYDKAKTVVDYFEKQVEQTPDNIALICNNEMLTYSELNKKANQLAHYLINNNVKAKDTIGIMVHRSFEMIIGILAILKVGACYLPIDPEYPTDRIQYMIDDSKCSTILVHNETINLLDDNSKCIDISLDSSIYSSSYTDNLKIDISGEDLIYIIYTSGSTGNPKGVMITHKNINNFILAEKQHIDFNENKVMLSVTTICFDIFALEIWCSLTSGMKVVLSNDDEQINPAALKYLCEKYSVNMIQTTPSRYSILLSDVVNSNFLSNVTDIMVGGEPFPKSLLSKLKEISNANIFNMYGPTETTVWSTIKDLTHTDDITIGKPLANTTCYILDKNKNLLPTLLPGELYIGGDGVAKGYWNRENLTKEKFIISPFNENEIIYNTGDLAYFDNNGELIHLGRTDFQVKIRGYRIELEEIQRKLLEFPDISNCVVIAKDNKFLVCYYISNQELSSSKISAFLLNYLPSYMVPSYYIKIDSIPMTPNGKLNRAKLPEVTNTDIIIEEAKTDTEIKISSVISEMVGVSRLDINTPFINLGLDSLGIINAQTKLLKYGLILTTQDFYKYFTIKKLAEKIDSSIKDNVEKDISIPPEFCHSDDELNPNKIDINIDEDSLNNVYLTGANGFIGIHILHELIINTDNIVYCLVRGKNKEHSLDRLRQTYNFYFNVDISKYIDNRIYIICSNIADENLGLSPNEINNFSTIIHTAAIIKHYGNFDDFEKINIRGTENVAKFAHRYNKRLIHISSISVSGNYLVKQDNRNVDLSENNIYVGQHYNDNVYVRSKLEAERIVLYYMKQGLTAQIHRIGILAGRYSDGVFQEKISENAFYARIKSIISIGAVSNDMLNQEIEFTPVDYCARAIVTLGKQSKCNNRFFHLYNPNLVKVSSLIELFRKYNINIKVLSKQEFNDYIYSLSAEQNNSSLKSIINDISFDANHLLSLNYDYTVNIKSKYTQQCLQYLGFTWPESNSTYIEKLLDYMINVGFIGL